MRLDFLHKLIAYQVIDDLQIIFRQNFPSGVIIVLGHVAVFKEAGVAGNKTGLRLFFEPKTKLFNFAQELRFGNAVVLSAIDAVDQALVITDFFSER